MGWEKYLGPNHSGEAPTDFEIHRAQMRHYDDYMVRHESSSGSLSSSYGGETTGRGGFSFSVGGPDVARDVSRGGRLSGSPDALHEHLYKKLEPHLEDKATDGFMFGFTWEANPFFSNIEDWAEARYGDIGGAVAAPLVFSADFVHNAARAVNFITDGYLDKPLTEIDQDIQGALSPSAAPMFNMHATTVAPDGVVWRTGGGF